MTKAAVGADALIKMGVEIGQQAGMLVRLTPESTKRFRELQKIKDSSGAAMGILRGADGKFAHILRFKPASALQSVIGIGGALSAIAMQAQLASIEAAIGEVGNKVDVLQATVDRVRESDGLATREVIVEVYRAAQSAGALTRAMWEQIAPLNQPVRRLQKYAELEAEALTIRLEGLKRRPIKERRSSLKEVEEQELQRVFDTLLRENRALAQFQALRLWHLIEVDDRGLSAYRHELGHELTHQAELLDHLRVALHDAVESADVRGRIEAWSSPFDARALEKRSSRILSHLSALELPLRSALQSNGRVGPKELSSGAETANLSGEIAAASRTTPRMPSGAQVIDGTAG